MIFKRIILLTLLLTTLQIVSCESEFAMEKCLVNILRWLEADCNYLVYSAEHNLITEVMQSEISVINVSIRRKITPWLVSGRSYLYIIVVKNIQDYCDFLDAFELSSAWKPRESFLIVLLAETNLEEIARLSHKYLIHKLLILTKSELLAYLPFKTGSCSFNNSELHHIACTETALDKVKNNELPLEFKNCQIRVASVPFKPYIISATKGLDLQIITEISSRLNISLHFLNANYPSWGEKLKDGTYTLMYGLLAKREADLMIGMVHGNSTVDDNFESTVSYTQDHANFFVPTALPVEAWRVFILTLHHNVWLLLITFLIIMVLVCWMVGNFGRFSYGYDKLDYCLLKVLCTWFSSHNNLPRTTPLSYLLTLWCYTSLLLNNLYQGKLTSFLTKPVYERQISTMEELSESQLLVGGFPTLKSHLIDKENKALAKINAQWIYCELDFSCVNRTAEKRDFAVAKSVRGVNYYTPKMYLDRNGNPKLFKIEDTIAMYLVRFTAVKGLPFFDRMNALIANLVDSGIVEKWLSDLQFNDQYEYRDEFRKISLEHLKIVMFAFFCGNVTALFVFFLELVSKKHYRT